MHMGQYLTQRKSEGFFSQKPSLLNDFRFQNATMKHSVLWAELSSDLFSLEKVIIPMKGNKVIYLYYNVNQFIRIFFLIFTLY